MRRITKLAGAMLLMGASAASSGAELNLKLEIPRLDVAEYHRPYVAVWVENQDQSTAAQLAVWYQTDSKKEDGTQWLKDLRQWWRRGGRELQMPVDGVTGATRPVGAHVLTYKGSDKQLATLAPGKYNVVVEATREVGGRELLRLPFEWPGTQKQTATAQGKTELGAITLNVTP
ncbi:hypothetical protein GCM10011487_67710 [Steroidobacter agaridevorans]|uniref:DUF2271 domain-containing protein n=1 Tax=Steroidobacter agaridevorans TaxID=2695856 RepID=A0A829YP75_9GAMM|nr:DUF2271 domain-containing protein [Steroidobacter agaridevorans]GFE84771.1 hypothetical protein GCM10011487_67710 [Steroidobacter agaridevorans]